MITPMLAMSRRELLSYVLSPSGYIIIALFTLFTGLLFFMVGAAFGGGFQQGQTASMQLVFSGGIWAFLFVAPAISMRTLSEEYRLGSIELLMTSPVREWQITLGKFFGSMGFLVIMLVPTLLFVVAVEMYGRPDYGEIACGYLGMMLCGGAFLATGVLFSTLTGSQVVAYLVTLFFWLAILLLAKGVPVLATLSEASIGRPDNSPLLESVLRFVAETGRGVAAADPHKVIRDFASGLIDTANIIYMLSMTAVALIASIVALQLRRWR